MKKHIPPRTCVACHAERLGKPVTASDCLGFAACETCTKVRDAWSEWLLALHEREGKENETGET